MFLLTPMTFSCLNLHAEVAHIAQLQLPALFTVVVVAVVAACVSLLRVVIVVCVSMCVCVCVCYIDVLQCTHAYCVNIMRHNTRAPSPPFLSLSAAQSPHRVASWHYCSHLCSSNNCNNNDPFYSAQKSHTNLNLP